MVLIINRIDDLTKRRSAQQAQEKELEKCFDKEL